MLFHAYVRFSVTTPTWGEEVLDGLPLLQKGDNMRRPANRNQPFISHDAAGFQAGFRCIAIFETKVKMVS